jgi:hypothetical protein
MLLSTNAYKLHEYEPQFVSDLNLHYSVCGYAVRRDKRAEFVLLISIDGDSSQRLETRVRLESVFC